ncbi:MAG: thioredoxin [Bacteroidetes bacterium]|nr:MAG: thioredoxin [Bacteroidota bacterium]
MCMNKYVFNPLLFVAVLFISISAASCQNTKQKDSTIAAKGGKVAVEEFEKLLTQTTDAQLIDVRTPDEYTGGHIANAVNINVNGDDFEQAVGALDKTKPVFVYCLAGSRSESAADYMRAQGFATVYELKGGVLKWQAAGKNLETGSATPKKQGMTQEEFLKKVTTENYVLVDYHATWCKPCIQMAPMLDKVAADKKDKLTLLKVDADENPLLMQQKGFSEIPVLELYHKGKLVWSHKGLIDEAALLSGTKL